MIRVWEQVNKGNEEVYYSWLTTGIRGTPKNKREMEYAGWKWIGDGTFATRHQSAAEEFCKEHNVKAESNGTHAIHGLRGRLCLVPYLCTFDQTSKTGIEAGERFAREYFTNEQREIESWSGNQFSLVYGNGVYEARMVPNGFEVWRVK